MTKLTKQDLEAALESELRQGTVGYTEREYVATSRERAQGDSIVVREANRQGWSFNQLVAWVDSKYGRWFWDELHGCKDAAAAARTVTLDWMDDFDRSLYGI